MAAALDTCTLRRTMKKIRRDLCIPLSEVKKKHGFSDRLVRELLGDPDITEPNPHFRRGAPVPLYYIPRVNKAKLSEAWIAYQPTHAREQAAAKKVANEKRQKTLAWAKSVEIQWHERTPESLDTARRGGFDHWCRQQDGYDPPGYEGMDMLDLDRLAVHYLRHENLPYEKRLTQARVMHGGPQAAQIIKRRCLRKIASRFPKLADECRQQEQGGNYMLSLTKYR